MAWNTLDIGAQQKGIVWNTLDIGAQQQVPVSLPAGTPMLLEGQLLKGALLSGRLIATCLIIILLLRG